MSKRTNENGFPYINDGKKIEEISIALTHHFERQVMTSSPVPSGFEDAIADHPEFEGLTNGEYWLAVARAFGVMQQLAMDRFYSLVTDRDDEDLAA